jgi:hypothetical protein
VVDDLADADELVAVVERVTGVEEIRDETEVAGLQLRTPRGRPSATG